LRYATTLGGDEADRVESTLTAIEVRAVASAKPTPHSDSVMHQCGRLGLRYAIVSNNSELAVRTYLSNRGIYDIGISARTNSSVSLLKPSPHLLTEAIDAVGIEASKCVFIGDSTADVAAALSAHIFPIGFANKSGKIERLMNAGASTLITSMDKILDQLPQDGTHE
jgi:HAD superfamily hydrolase (TIGR01549 family)